jgi:hypothetical protein
MVSHCVIEHTDHKGSKCFWALDQHSIVLLLFYGQCQGKPMGLGPWTISVDTLPTDIILNRGSQSA